MHDSKIMLERIYEILSSQYNGLSSHKLVDAATSLAGCNELEGEQSEIEEMMCLMCHNTVNADSFPVSHKEER